MNELRFTFLNTSPFLHVCKLQTNLFFLTRLPSCKKSVYQQGKRTASGINHAVLEMVDCLSFVLFVLCCRCVNSTHTVTTWVNGTDTVQKIYGHTDTVQKNVFLALMLYSRHPSTVEYGTVHYIVAICTSIYIYRVVLLNLSALFVRAHGTTN